MRLLRHNLVPNTALTLLSNVDAKRKVTRLLKFQVKLKRKKVHYEKSNMASCGVSTDLERFLDNV